MKLAGTRQRLGSSHELRIEALEPMGWQGTLVDELGACESKLRLEATFSGSRVIRPKVGSVSESRIPTGPASGPAPGPLVDER